MATVAGIKIKPKVSKPRGGVFADEQYTGSEPVWDTERALKMPDEQFDHHLRKSFYYYNYYYTQKECKPHVSEWMERSGKYTSQQIRAFNRASDKSIPMTVCSLIMAHRAEMPLLPRHLEFLDECINRAIESVYNLASELDDIEIVKPTIQDRLNEKTCETIGELEGHFDEFVSNSSYDFDPYNFLVQNNVPQSQLGKYEEKYKNRLTEYKLAYAKSDEQLIEGYKQYKAQDFKRIIAFLTKILDSIEQYRGIKKATKKVRAPRATSKEKLVSKLKYSKEFASLKIISINPVDILGAQVLWVYNTKTRKLGQYVADSQTGPLGVKGTTITGFDVVKSVCKTLRKPDEKLKEFNKSSKVELRKFLTNINATETTLNGRISADIVLLKVQ
jgi:hypothetical protein